MKDLATLYKELMQEFNSIPAQIYQTLQKIDKIKKQISDLKKKVTELDLKISSLPPTVDKKVCRRVLFWKHCQHVQVPNPEIARLTGKRNKIAMQIASLRNQMEQEYKKILDLAKRETQLKQKMLEIRARAVSLLEQAASEPIKLLDVLGLRKQPKMQVEKVRYELSEETKETEVEKFDYKPYLLLALGLAAGVFILKRRE